MEPHMVFVSLRDRPQVRPSHPFLRFCRRLTVMSVLVLIQSRCSHAPQVIGGNVTVVQGGTVVLPCKLTDTTEALTQISWQRTTRGKPHNDNFFTILPTDGPKFVNGYDKRFEFIGSLNEKNGSLQLSDVTLVDEGVYTCIFTLFPTGNYKTEIPLNVLVPPVTYVKDNVPVLGDEEVSLATCTAAGSKPPAGVRWLTGTLAEKVRATTNSTQHANGTTTTVSSLLGVPTRDINQRSVQCVITSPALSKEETIPFITQVYFSPMEVNISATSKDSFQCVTEANPTAKFTWRRSGQSLPQSAVRVDGATLQFLSMGSALNGLYQCEASNRYGTGHGYLYVHLTSGTCTACWTIFGLLLFLIVIGVSAWYLYKSGKCPRTKEDTRGKRQKVRTASSESDRVQEEPNEAEL